MNVLVLGATGTIGRHIVAELAHRGHHTLSGLRTGSEASPPPGDTVVVDPLSPDSVAAAARGVHAVVSALGGSRHGHPGLVREAMPVVVQGLEGAHVHRLLVVGGAGSLLDIDGRRRVDATDFPAAWRAGSLAQADALGFLRAYTGPVNWSYLSPSDRIGDGPRGGVELGENHLLRAPNGESWISLGDYSGVLVDELERNHHPRRRFTARSERSAA
ncbi:MULTISPECIES: NAD(P)-dependent oxidoreductase [unclassified Streptomyces]|uniref:NAD(P)-dependent oxidoreductase n=1 Tax=unclassified Streptomyces TaxID=2593676 RepID=UPI003720E765